MLKIGTETPAMAEAIYRIHFEAFGRPDEGRLVDALRQGDTFVPGLSLVAELDGDLVGHILFTKIQIRDGEMVHPALALAPLAVLPACQRQGIGSRLVSEGLAACASRGSEPVVVLGHPDYYPRFGFQPARRFGIYPPFSVRDEVFMVWAGDWSQMKLIRGKVVYPAAFAGV